MSSASYSFRSVSWLSHSYSHTTTKWGGQKGSGQLQVHLLGPQRWQTLQAHPASQGPLSRMVMMFVLSLRTPSIPGVEARQQRESCWWLLAVVNIKLAINGWWKILSTLWETTLYKHPSIWLSTSPVHCRMRFLIMFTKGPNKENLHLTKLEHKRIFLKLSAIIRKDRKLTSSNPWSYMC